MPGGDRTGPMGEGPMTGRGSGNCGDDKQPERARFGRGWRNMRMRGNRSRGKGFGWRARGDMRGQYEEK